MKKFAKYMVLFGVVAFVAVAANAEITVKESTSPEFIHNAGYSAEVSRIIEVKTRDYATPIPVEKKGEKAKRLKWYMWKFIDPSVDRPNDFVNHDIKYSNTIDDL